MHLLHKCAEQTKVVMRGIAERRSVGGRMHVRNIRPDGEVNGHRDAVLVSGNEHAAISVFDIDDPARKILSWPLHHHSQFECAGITLRFR